MLIIFCTIVGLTATELLPDWFGIRKRAALLKLTDNYKIDINFSLPESDIQKLNKSDKKESFIKRVKNNIIETIYQKLLLTKNQASNRISVYFSQSEGYNMKNSYNIIILINLSDDNVVTMNTTKMKNTIENVPLNKNNIFKDIDMQPEIKKINKIFLTKHNINNLQNIDLSKLQNNIIYKLDKSEITNSINPDKKRNVIYQKQTISVNNLDKFKKQRITEEGLLCSASWSYVVNGTKTNFNGCANVNAEGERQNPWCATSDGLLDGTNKPFGNCVPEDDSPVVCFDNTERVEPKYGWVWAGIGKSFGDANKMCNGYKYLSISCPKSLNDNVEFDVFCGNELNLNPIPKNECTGNTNNKPDKKNQYCNGPSKHDGKWLGGYNKSAIYTVI